MNEFDSLKANDCTPVLLNRAECNLLLKFLTKYMECAMRKELSEKYYIDMNRDKTDILANILSKEDGADNAEEVAYKFIRSYAPKMYSDTIYGLSEMIFEKVKSIVNINVLIHAKILTTMNELGDTEGIDLAKVFTASVIFYVYLLSKCEDPDITINDDLKRIYLEVKDMFTQDRLSKIICADLSLIVSDNLNEYGSECDTDSTDDAIDTLYLINHLTMYYFVTRSSSIDFSFLKEIDYRKTVKGGNNTYDRIEFLILMTIDYGYREALETKPYGDQFEFLSRIYLKFKKPCDEIHDLLCNDDKLHNSIREILMRAQAEAMEDMENGAF